MGKQKLFGLLLSFALLFSTVIGCSSRSSSDAQDEPLDIPVHAVTIGVEQVGNTHHYTGTFSANQDNIIYPKLTSQLKTLYVKKGDVVTEGQELALIDDADVRNQVQQAQAQLDSAKANLEQGLIGNDNNLIQAQIAVDNAKKNLEEAQKHVERLSTLNESGAVSNNELEQAKTALHQAENAYKQATNQLNAASNNANITSLESVVKQAESSLKSAQDHYKDTRITSPIKGEVVEIHAEVGEMVTPSAPFIRVINRDQMIFTFQVYEDQLLLLQKDMNISIQVPSLQKSLEGTIRYVGLAPLNNTKSYPVEVVVDNTERILMPGMLGEAEIKTNLIDAITIPVEALVERDGKTFAYVIKEGKAHLQEISVQNFNSKKSIVLSGITAGEEVVTKGKYTVTDGAKVRIVGGNSK